MGPIMLTVNLEDGLFNSETLEEGPVLVQRRQLKGDYANLRAVCHSFLKRIIEIKIEFDSGERKTLYFSQAEAIEVPPETSPTMSTTADVIVETTTLEILVEARSGFVVDLRVRNIEITLW